MQNGILTMVTNTHTHTWKSKRKKELKVWQSILLKTNTNSVELESTWKTMFYIFSICCIFHMQDFFYAFFLFRSHFALFHISIENFELKFAIRQEHVFNWNRCTEWIIISFFYRYSAVADEIMAKKRKGRWW